MIPTINVIIIDDGITTRHEFRQENIALDGKLVADYLTREYRWPDPFDFSVENGINIWTTFSFTQEEAQEYDKVRKWLVKQDE